MIKEPEDNPLDHIPFQYWPKEKQEAFDAAAALKYQEKENQIEQELQRQE